MTYSKYGFRLFRKKPVLSILLAIQMAVGIFLLNFIVTTINVEKVYLKTAQPILSVNAVYFSNIEEENFAGIKEYPNGFEKLKGVKFMSDTLTDGFTYGNNEIYLYTYSKEFAELAKTSLQSGIWFTQAKTQNTVPVVVDSETSAYKLGDIIEIDTKYYIENEEYSKKTLFEIVGVLDERKLFVEFGSSGNIRASDFIKSFDSEYSDGRSLFLTSYEFLDVPDEAFKMYMSNMFVVFNDDISESDMNYNLSVLKDIGVVSSAQDITQETQNEINLTLNRIMPFVVCVIILSLVGIISSNVLNALTQSKTFAIFYMCGGRWKHISLSYLVYMMYIFLISVLISIVGLLITFSNELGNFGIYFTSVNVFITLGILLFCIVFSVLPPYIILKRTQPVTIIQKYS